ncbi:hypothetical protein [Streptomyces sp. NBC_01198]|uniref:hypothetical protein n=1 Tax=Streptomyces sp. NBC_01198 TaxID=2903769 RepID=UPI002E0E02CA|nr:hypothetical protein OG702_34860 [Streptomyces sp. NBC_01198]
MDIKWSSLGEVAVVSLAVTVVVVVMFSLGVVAWTRMGALRGGGPVGTRERVAAGAAALCFAACLGIAAYGIDVIIPD